MDYRIDGQNTLTFLKNIIQKHRSKRPVFFVWLKLES